MANRLIREKSPYLLQHAHNPVDWYPWADEAFAEAKASQRPIFLSIGYSTCHWCHVMERESFENARVAELLNRWFVPVKVDREERPDVDRLYMTAMQAMGMGGGWPLNCFLTPEREPFFGGTYFPPDGRFGRMGMVDLLPRVHEAWTEQREQLRATGRQVIEALASVGAPEGTGVDRAPFARVCFDTLARHHDAAHGGFGTAPKFPSIPNLHFLFRHAGDVAGEQAAARTMALRQLDAMRAGGIHDHLGGGFHRYSTDATWLVPHFEKMLYDQAQIAWSYLEAFQITGSETYAVTARGIFEYVLRDLLSPGGAFDSAEDADSEGEEGTFYVWTPEQVAATAGAKDAAIFGHRYGVTAAGNFEHGTSILHEAHTIDETAERFAVTPEAAVAAIERAAARLLEARGRRVRPYRDDKVITAWNGLMISAFARGARVLGEDRYRAAAERAATFVWERLRDPETGELRRRWRDGESAGQGQLEDHACLALGLIDLYSATLDPVWLERAVALTEAMIVRFEDVERGGFFESPAGDPHVAVRMKSDYDGAEPAANSIAAANLWTLGTLLDRRAWLEKAERTFASFAPRLTRTPNAMPQMIAAMERARSSPRHIVIAGDPAAADTRALLAETNRRFLPHDLVLLVDGGEAQRRLAALAPFVGPLAPRDGRATAYLCVDFACRLPTTDPSAFAAQLDEATSPPPQESSTP